MYSRGEHGPAAQGAGIPRGGPTTRRKLLVGNWKMHGMRSALAEIAAIDRVAAGADVVLCLPATLLAIASERVAHAQIGAQDCHGQERGAFTGRLSAPMLADAGARWVLLGHSECRSDGASDAAIRAQLAAATPYLMPILCVGEQQRSDGIGPVVDQLLASLWPAADPARLVVAYEPVWAIGRGVAPAPETVNAAHAALRAALGARFGADGEGISLLYGGSVSAANAGALLAQPMVDGLLVGGASLRAESFLPILAQMRPHFQSARPRR